MYHWITEIVNVLDERTRSAFELETRTIDR